MSAIANANCIFMHIFFIQLHQGGIFLIFAFTDGYIVKIASFPQSRASSMSLSSLWHTHMLYNRKDETEKLIELVWNNLCLYDQKYGIICVYMIRNMG